MRTLKRNKQTLYYALYNSKTDETDSFGDKTGFKVSVYDKPVDLKANVSAARGSSDSELFGIDLDYNRTVCVEGIDCPIKEDTILWIESTPDNDNPYNYVVVAKAKSLNNIVYAIKEVKVTGKVSFVPDPVPPTPPEPEDEEVNNVTDND